MQRPLSYLRVGSLALCWILSACATSRNDVREGEEEQVEVGYGQQDKKTATGSVTAVDVDKARKQSDTSVSEMLQGRVAGVQVFETASGIRVVIRGSNSFSGDTDPLYVIDGVPTRTDSYGGVPLNPIDIKSISVLKGASAAIYGSRGANGVIVIKTHRGTDE